MNRAFISKRMQELGLDREALARASGITPNSMRNILGGLIPSKSVLICMAAALKCEVNDLLLAGDGESKAAAGKK